MVSRAPFTDTNASQRPRGRLSLRRNFSWILVGSLVENAAKWAMFVLLTKLLSSDDVGSFSLALAVATPITILGQLQLRVTLITDARNEFPFGAYYAMRLATVVLSGGVVTLVGFGLYGVGFTGSLIALVGLSQSITSLRDIWMALSQRQEQMNVTATGNMLDGVLSLVLFGAGLLLIGTIHWAVFGMIIARTLTLVVYDMPRARSTLDEGMSSALVWNREMLEKLFWVTLPLGLTTAMVSLNSNIPQYFNEHWLGRKEVGYFAAIVYFVFAARLVIVALSRAASPRLAHLYHENRAAFGSLLIRLLSISTLVGGAGVLGALLFGEYFLHVFYSAEYAQQAHILTILMIAGGIRFVNAFLGVAISAARFFKIQPVIYSVVSVTTLLSCWALIPRWGLEGAAWATVIVSAVNTLINGGVAVYVYNHDKPSNTDKS